MSNAFVAHFFYGFLCRFQKTASLFRLFPGAAIANNIYHLTIKGGKETMKKTSKMVRQSAVLALMATLALGAGCSPEKPTPVKTVEIADGTIDPALWGKAYPVEYDMWKKTGEPTPAGKSKYKKGNDGGVTYDKLSE